MNTAKGAAPINLQAVSEFWREAFDLVNLHSNSALFGEQSSTGLFPPPFQFSLDRSEATEVAQAVLSGERTQWVSPRDAFGEGVGMPADGDMSIICDGEGLPVALISNTDVSERQAPNDPKVKVVVETFTVLFPAAN